MNEEQYTFPDYIRTMDCECWDEGNSRGEFCATKKPFLQYDDEVSYVRYDLVPRWHDPKEELPCDGQDVLFINDGDETLLGFYGESEDSRGFYFNKGAYDCEFVKAWMPIPELEND